MMLVDLAVYSGRDLLMLLRVDVLFSNGLANILVDDGLVLASIGEKVGNCLLSLFHVIGCWLIENLEYTGIKLCKYKAR